MKVFIDTSPFIYLIESHPEYGHKVKQLFANSIIEGHDLLTSVVSLSEYSVKPNKENKPELIEKFEELLDRLNIEIFVIDKPVAKKASELRADYAFLKGLDAFQLAVAINQGCGVFITNDKDLKKVSYGIQIKILDEI